MARAFAVRAAARHPSAKGCRAFPPPSPLDSRGRAFCYADKVPTDQLGRVLRLRRIMQIAVARDDKVWSAPCRSGSRNVCVSWRRTETGWPRTQDQFAAPAKMAEKFKPFLNGVAGAFTPEKKPDRIRVGQVAVTRDDGDGLRPRHPTSGGACVVRIGEYFFSSR
jgi:hypothetical protein